MCEEDRGPFASTVKVRQVALHLALPLVVVSHVSLIEV
jgi:hypothetical protein